jgi:hypothetical protein
VSGFDEHSQAVLLWSRVATAEANRRLSEFADAVREQLVARSGLDIRVVHDRLNRRKIDLIPLDAWRDPPESDLGALLTAVETGLAGAGMRGGVREVIELAERIAREHGMIAAAADASLPFGPLWIGDYAMGPLGFEPRTYGL